MRKWLPLLPICLGTVMFTVDITIVGVAMPELSTALHASYTALQWSIDGYVLVLAALVMAVGAASDRLGRRRVYLAGTAIFALASLGCGAASTIELLILGRALQGLGAAAMMVTNTALLAGTYDGRERGIAFGVWSGVTAVSAAGGPLVGGILTEQFGWRSIFLVNVPLAAIALVSGRRWLSPFPGTATTRIDVPGTLVFVCAATLTIFGLTRAGGQGWGDVVVPVCFAGAAVALVAFWLIERRSPHPMIDLALLRRASLLALLLATLVFNAASVSDFVYRSIWLQSVVGLKPLMAGLALTPMGAAALVSALLTGRYANAADHRRPIGFGLLLIAAGAVAGRLLMSADASWTALVPGLVISGAGVGMCSPVLASAVLAVAPPHRAGMASGIANTLLQLGFALGMPVAGTILTASIRHTLTDAAVADPGAATLAIANGHPTDLSAQTVHAAFAMALDKVFLLDAALALAAALLVLLLMRPTRSAESPEPALAGHR
ncbi:MFS transporter [Actinoallomurus sp. CA-150999]|uniref:MFS transporter n=1 Tax=Actinoallomurus sp. CA-150999 TaxID=3239887 RepID=UPI003D8E56BF